MYKAIISLLVLLTFNTVSAMKISDHEVNEALIRLDYELTRRASYIAKRNNTIDSIKEVCTASPKPLDFLQSTMDLADVYTSFNNDSALHYYSVGVKQSAKLHNDSLNIAFRLKLATHMPLAALIDSSVKEYQSVDSTTLNGKLKELYYDSGRQMYSYISSFYTSHPDIYNEWKEKEWLAQKQLLAITDQNTLKYKLNLGEVHFENEEYSSAKAILEDLIATIPSTNNIYARAAHKLAEIAKIHNNQNGYIYFLAQSAISDIQTATLEVMSLQELGEILFEINDIDRAHRYLLTAITNAVECGASMRMIQSSSALPVIEEAHRAEIDVWQHRIYAILIGMALLILMLGGVLLLLKRQMRKLTLTRQSLEEANHIKEVYMSQFLNLSSIYMDKLNQFCRTVNVKISANKVDDLYRITKSGKFIEEQSKEFYDIFDDAFLHIYPTFVDSVNKLLRDDEQITLKGEEKLNTDLRILAFMRLGIDETPRIAQILNFSVNTIYSYKNKLKNRAIDRNTFEKDLMKIGAISSS